MSNRCQLYAYALATAEENASGGVVVTAPTCGSCGVLPAVLYHLSQVNDYRPIRIKRALATAGLFRLTSFRVKGMRQAHEVY